MFSKIDLPYELNSLAPVIGEETVSIHYNKHHQTYVDNINKALADSDALKLPLHELLSKVTAQDAGLQQVIRNNGGGVYNHNLY